MELYKRICGNCILRNEKKTCEIDYREKPPNNLACFRIEDNFEDKGFESTLTRAPSIDHQKINKEVLKGLGEDLIRIKNLITRMEQGVYPSGYPQDNQESLLQHYKEEEKRLESRINSSNKTS